MFESRLQKGKAGGYPPLDSTGIIPPQFLKTAGYFGATFDGGGTVILVNSKTYFRMPKAGIINSWSIIAVGPSPICTLDVWKVSDGTVLPTVAESITANDKPSLVTGNAVSSTYMPDWVVNFDENDIFAINVNTAINAIYINFVLKVTWIE